MRIAFTAIEASFDEDEGRLIAMLSTGDNGDEGEGHYLSFQRPREDSPVPRFLRPSAKDNLYFEIDDQGYGGYGLVRSCRLDRDGISVDFAKPLDDLPGVEGIDVRLAIDSESFEHLRAGLSRLFHGMTDRLTLP